MDKRLEVRRRILDYLAALYDSCQTDGARQPALERIALLEDATRQGTGWRNCPLNDEDLAPITASVVRMEVGADS